MPGSLFRVGSAVLLLLSALMPARAAPPPPPPPPPLEAYGNLPGIEELVVSPDGARLGILAKIENIRRVMVIDVAGKVYNVSDVGDAKIRGLQWVGNNYLKIVTSSTEPLGPGFTTSKIEAFSSIMLPVDGGKAEIVFEKSPSLLNAIFGDYGVRQVDGKWLALFAAIELRQSTGSWTSYEFDHGRPALYSWDVARGSARRVARSAGPGHTRRWQLDEKGEVAATLDLDVSGNWEVTNAEGRSIARGLDPTGDIDLVALGREGSSVIYSLEDDKAGTVRWFEVPLVGGEPKEILPDADIERVYVDPLNGRLLGYLPKESDKPELFDPAQQSILRRVYRAFGKRVVSILDWTPDFKFFVVRTRGNNDSGTFYLVDIGKLKADPIGYERPEVGSAHVGPISTVPYRAADGLEMDGILTLPPGREARNLPVVMLPHGGPHAHDEATFDWWAQAIASRGYAVFQPNFRGSTNRDGVFRRAGYGEWGRKMQSDISDGLAELARQGIVDPRRACIVGASFGGYAALAGVTLQQGLYRCAVAVAPVSDVKQMYQTDLQQSGYSPMTRRSLLESLGDPKAFDAVSPRRFANRADAPILLIHGKDDTVVPFSQSQSMANALRDAGKPYELVVLREEDHWLSRGPTRLQMLEETVRFLQQHNPAN